MSRRDMGAALVLAAALLCSGCGSSEPDPAASGGATSVRPKSGAPARPDMVAAVSAERLEHPAIGTPLPHVVTVIPRGDGIFYVTAVIVSDSPTESVSRNYAIPIIAGTGLAELPETAAPRPESARAQP
jgi:hypothetical protein